MKTLLLMRHGKASRDSAEDRERPLTKRGRRSVEKIARVLLDERLVPDRILTSSAVRARDTARLLAEELHFERAVDELDELYLAEPQTYIDAVVRLGGPGERVLIVGHNPTLEMLISTLTGEPAPLKTAALAECALPIANFGELSLAVRGKLRMLWSPKDIEA